jgi:hypothetical protein
MIEKLAEDGDPLVKTKAQHVLKATRSGLGSDVYEPVAGTRGEGGSS